VTSSYTELNPPGDQITLAAQDMRAAPEGAILIVDDEDLLCRTYCKAFESAGYRTLTAKSGVGVLSILQEQNIRAVILDIFMPDGDGLETLMSIKRASPETIVIVMSGGNSSFDYLDIASKLGADEIVRKPAAPTVLLDMLAKLSPDNAAVNKADRRKFERIRMDLVGQLFNPIDWQTVGCRVLNLGAGGALIACESRPAEGSLVLYVEHFGRFEGTIVHRSSSLFGLQFAVGEAKRGRLQEMLASFAEHGAAGLSNMRNFPRFKSDGSVTLVRPSGRTIACDVLDISPDGVSLRTTDLPPIGELVRVGKTCGRVVRHHDEGIAMRFIRDPSERR
jgi:CheY-like chemotaxis protein